MDSFFRLFRPRLWLYCLLCVLSVLIGSGANASTRKHVSMPSAQSVSGNPSGPATRTGNSLFVPGQPLEGEFIPGVDGKKIPVRGILPTIDFSIPRTINQGKNLLKGGAIGVGVSLGIDWLVGQIGGFIDDHGVVQVPTYTEAPPSDGSIDWVIATESRQYYPGSAQQTFTSPQLACEWAVANYSRSGYSVSGGLNNVTKLNEQRFQCSFSIKSTSGTLYDAVPKVDRRGTSCPDGASYDSSTGRCLVLAFAPATDPDIDRAFGFANGKDAAWLHSLFKDICANSPSPARCFEEMKQNSALNGPASVPGSTTTQTTNSVSPAGVATQTVTTTKNTYNFTYGPTYYDYRKTTQIITTENGEPKSDTTIEEPVEPEQEERPPEEQQEEPVLCAGQGCDGPAYVDQYEPTDATKEEAIDSYMSRIQSIPIIAAVGGLFSVNVTGSCPVWEVNSSLNIMGASMPIDLRFDYLCLPWVVSLKPWIQAVMIAVCLMLAIRIALL